MQPERQQRGKRTVAAPVPAAGTKRRKKVSKPAAAAHGGDDDQKRTRNPNWVVDEVKMVGDLQPLHQAVAAVNLNVICRDLQRCLTNMRT